MSRARSRRSVRPSQRQRGRRRSRDHRSRSVTPVTRGAGRAGGASCRERSQTRVEGVGHEAGGHDVQLVQGRGRGMELQLVVQLATSLSAGGGLLEVGQGEPGRRDQRRRDVPAIRAPRWLTSGGSGDAGERLRAGVDDRGRQLQLVALTSGMPENRSTSTRRPGPAGRPALAQVLAVMTAGDRLTVWRVGPVGEVAAAFGDDGGGPRPARGDIRVADGPDRHLRGVRAEGPPRCTARCLGSGDLGAICGSSTPSGRLRAWSWRGCCSSGSKTGRPYRPPRDPRWFCLPRSVCPRATELPAWRLWWPAP